MKLKSVLIVGSAAAVAWWLMAKRGGTQVVQFTGTGFATITGVNGQPYTLYQDKAGQVRDQNGGLWV